MTDHFPDVRKMVPNDRQVNILTDEQVKGIARTINPHWWNDDIDLLDFTRAVLVRARMTDELHNANADVKRFREAASCERDVRRVLEKQVSTLQAELRRLHAENEALRTELAEEHGLRMRLLHSTTDEALLWLCREMLRELPIVHPQQGPRRDELIQALNERLSNG